MEKIVEKSNMVISFKRNSFMRFETRSFRFAGFSYIYLLIFLIFVTILIFPLLHTGIYRRNKLVAYDASIPLIWIGGIPRSGTTLMRSMLDAHEEVRCGQETHILGRVLSMHNSLINGKGMAREEAGGVTRQVLLNATGAYVLSIIAEHGSPAPRLCNKDPFTLSSIKIVLEMFPNSKFLFMIRDGRATCHSIITRSVVIGGFDSHSYKGCLRDWNKAIENMHKLCSEVGLQFCLPVKYENLVLHPRSEMTRVLRYLELAWSENVLHHEEFVGKDNGVILSDREPSTGQVRHPVNMESLTSWQEFLPEQVKADLDTIAPMIAKLGYNTKTYPVSYGQPDAEVLVNTRRVEKRRERDGPTAEERKKAAREEEIRQKGSAFSAGKTVQDWSTADEDDEDSEVQKGAATGTKGRPENLETKMNVYYN